MHDLRSVGQSTGQLFIGRVTIVPTWEKRIPRVADGEKKMLLYCAVITEDLLIDWIGLALWTISSPGDESDGHAG
ncbi:hypothetical protein LTR28_002493, partial [Elasticomyces elasticus]